MNATKPYSSVQTSHVLSSLDLTRHCLKDGLISFGYCTILLFVFCSMGWLGSTLRIKRDLGWIISIGALLNWRILASSTKHFLLNETAIYAAFVCAVQAIYASSLSRSFGKNARNNKIVQPGQRSFLRPTIFPCETTHTRLFPEKHSFSYSYLFIGVPVILHDARNIIPPFDPSTNATQQITSWFSVHAEDYLERGIYSQGFKGKLQEYLAQQGAHLDEYPFAYLVTAPRFLGFSFNPVSFWYLFDKHQHLSAMILEVNNTFDERRMYFMRNVTAGNREDNKYNFTNSWEKDFHVSPFNDRHGTYSLTATDPFQVNDSKQAKVDNKIALLSPDGKAKLVARIFSTEASLVAEELSQFQTLRFVLRWWWVGFMTNPRILREARVLWWKKKLKVFFRPEVMRSSIGRTETTEESTLEPFFRRYLHQLADESNSSIDHIPAAGPDRAKIISITPKQENNIQIEQSRKTPIEIKILTPAFYSELVRSRSLSAVFDKYSFDAAPGEAMVYTSAPELLRRMIANTMPSPNGNAPQSCTALLNRLLKHKEWPWALDGQAKDLSFEAWTSYFSSKAEISKYEATSSKILLADRVALGSTALLRFYVSCVWLYLCFDVVTQLQNTIFSGSLDFRFYSVASLSWKVGLMHGCSRFTSI